MGSITDNKYNLTAWQGSTFGLQIQMSQDLSNFSSKMQIRPSYKSAVITESLSTATGEITISANTSSTNANSTIQLVLPADRTANIKVDLTNGRPPKSVYVYDLEISDSSNNVSKVLYGDFVVYGEVTR